MPVFSVSCTTLLLLSCVGVESQIYVAYSFQKLKWELVDLGSLNGTLLNSRAVHRVQTGTRHWGDPVELNSGDVITLGTASKISVSRHAKLDIVLILTIFSFIFKNDYVLDNFAGSN